jgi:hypothetical protein
LQQSSFLVSDDETQQFKVSLTNDNQPFATHHSLELILSSLALSFKETHFPRFPFSSLLDHSAALLSALYSHSPPLPSSQTKHRTANPKTL